MNFYLFAILLSVTVNFVSAGRGCFSYNPPESEPYTVHQKVPEAAPVSTPSPAVSPACEKPAVQCTTEQKPVPKPESCSEKKSSSPFVFQPPRMECSSNFKPFSMDMSDGSMFKPKFDNLPIGNPLDMISSPFLKTESNKPMCAQPCNFPLSGPPNNRFSDPSTSGRGYRSHYSSPSSTPREPRTVQCEPAPGSHPINSQSPQCNTPTPSSSSSGCAPKQGNEHAVYKSKDPNEMTEEEKFEMVNKVCNAIPKLFSGGEPGDLFNPVAKLEKLGVPMKKTTISA